MVVAVKIEICGDKTEWYEDNTGYHFKIHGQYQMLYEMYLWMLFLTTEGQYRSHEPESI